MRKILSVTTLVLGVLAGASGLALGVQPAAAACNGTVHLPNCGASGNYC